MAIIPQAENGSIIPVTLSQVTLTVDPVKGYAVVLDLVTMQQSLTVTSGIGLNFDGSGSMYSSDPLRLRVTAGKHFLRQLRISKPSSMASVAEFGVDAGDSYYFHLCLDFITVSDTEELFPAIDSLTESGSTPLYTSLRRTLEHIDSTLSAAQYARCVLSFIVGRDNDNYPEDSLGPFTALANAKNTRVFAVGLDYGVVTEGLQRLTTSTVGVYAWADSAPVVFNIPAPKRRSAALRDYPRAW